MVVRVMAVGVAVLIGAVPVAAQQRGTVEFGLFGSATSFDKDLGMTSGFGLGGRVGMYITPRVSLEFEGGGISAGRPGGQSNVNVGVLSVRAMTVLHTFGRVSALLGGGIDHTDTYAIESYGVHGLLGARVPLSRAVALRVDGIASYLANGHYTDLALHVGLSVRRNPRGSTRTVTTPAPAPTAQRPDSVSAAETRRLRDVELAYRAMLDSLARLRALPPGSASSAAALATMQEMIFFRREQSDLSDSAKAILDSKLAIFRANPAMRIVIVGFASEPGTPEYNMALGFRRAASAKAYLVSQGVDPTRIEISTRGEERLRVEGPGEAANAANRRDQFRLLIANPYLVEPNR